jgi:hypothetical protein
MALPFVEVRQNPYNTVGILKSKSMNEHVGILVIVELLKKWLAITFLLVLPSLNHIHNLEPTGRKILASLHTSGTKNRSRSSDSQT